MAQYFLSWLKASLPQSNDVLAFPSFQTTTPVSVCSIGDVTVDTTAPGTPRYSLSWFRASMPVPSSSTDVSVAPVGVVVASQLGTVGAKQVFLSWLKASMPQAVGVVSVDVFVTGVGSTGYMGGVTVPVPNVSFSPTGVATASVLGDLTVNAVEELTILVGRFAVSSQKTLSNTSAEAKRGLLAPVFIACPLQDIAASTWTAVGAATLKDAVGEFVPNDATYIRSQDDPTGTEEFEIKLEPLSNPGINTGRILHYRLRAVGNDTTFNFKLICGSAPGVQIDAWSDVVAADGNWHQFAKSIAANAIADYTDLRVRGKAGP